ncbi:MAG: hypothetical protein QM704_26420 [Anaeromyxobacteraceae bacterium]
MRKPRRTVALAGLAAVLAALAAAPAVARAYRAYQEERLRALAAAAFDAARRGIDDLPTGLPQPEAESGLMALLEGDQPGQEAPGEEQDEALLRGLYSAIELGVPGPEYLADLARIAGLEATRWITDPALAPGGPVPAGQSPSVQGAAPWRTMGPYWARNQFNGTYYKAADAGRVNALRLHPTNPAIAWAATSGGGLWKTTGLGSSPAAPATPSWIPLTDTLGALAIGSFDVAATDPNVLYVGLGDHVDQQFGAFSKTIDGGATWSPVSMLTAVHPADGATVTASAVREVAVDPLDANHAFFATDAGLFVTTDGGATRSIVPLPKPAAYAASREGLWTVASLGGNGWVVSGVYACPGLNGPNTALQMGNLAACPAPNAALGNLGDVWRSLDGGATWSSARTTGALDAALLATGAIGRIELGVARAADPATARVYALAASQTDGNSTAGILRSGDGGATWTVVSRNTAPVTAPINPTTGSADCQTMNLGHAQSYYDLAIAVDPGNPDNVFAAGDLCSVRSRDGGATWELVSHWLPTSGRGTTAKGPLPYAHADWHAASVYRVNGKAVVLGGNDGGFFLSRDVFDADVGEQVHWDQPGYGMATHLMYSVGSGDPATGNPGVLFSGLQDNGTRWALNTDNEVISTSVELKVWDQLIGGDGIGTAVALDPAGRNPVLWASVQQSRRFCRPRARDCGVPTRIERGTERTNWVSISLAGVLPAGDGEPFFIRYADLGDGWVSSVTNQNVWRFRPNENDQVSFSRLTNGITGCGSATNRTIRGIGPTVLTNATVDGVPARLYGLPLNGGCAAIVTEKTQAGTVAVTGAATSIRANDSGGNAFLVSFTSSVALPRNPASLGGADPRLTYLVSSNAPAGLNASNFAVVPIPAEVGRLFRTTDGGATWTAFHGNGTGFDLPNVGIYVVRYDYSDPTDQTIYAGTELGLYRTTDGGLTWARVGVGLPLVRVTDVAISRSGGVVRASTFGRGMWELQVKSEPSATAGTGDFDANGLVNPFDVMALASRLGVPPLGNLAIPTVPFYDSDLDLGGANPALIQEDDLSALLAKFGSTP